jgi:hypothetical protein
MALPTNGRISKRDVFNEIFGSLPDVSNIFSLKSLVEASCLPPDKKVAPHKLRYFLGYDHSMCSISEGTTFSWLENHHQCAFESSTDFTFEGLQCVLIHSDPVPATEYTSSYTYTANCLNGSGSSTSTKIATSTISKADADTKAYNAAKADAESNLVCTFNSTKSYTANTCPDGLSGSYTSTKSATSTISQADADSKALAAAQADAESKLVCSPSCTPYGTYYSTVCEGGYYHDYYHDGNCGYYSVNTYVTCGSGGGGELEAAQ